MGEGEVGLRTKIHNIHPECSEVIVDLSLHIFDLKKKFQLIAMHFEHN